MSSPISTTPLKRLLPTSDEQPLAKRQKSLIQRTDHQSKILNSTMNPATSTLKGKHNNTEDTTAKKVRLGKSICKRGLILAKEGHFEKAIDDLERIIKKYKHTRPLSIMYLTQAEVYLKWGKYKETLHTLSELAETNLDEESHNAQEIFQNAYQSVQQALKNLEIDWGTSKRACPTELDIKIRTIKIKSLSALNRKTEAKQTCLEGLSHLPRELILQKKVTAFYLSTMACIQENLTASEALFTQASNICTTNTYEVLLARTDFLIRQKNWQDALALIESVVRNRLNSTTLVVTGRAEKSDLYLLHAKIFLLADQPENALKVISDLLHSKATNKKRGNHEINSYCETVKYLEATAIKLLQNKQINLTLQAANLLLSIQSESIIAIQLKQKIIG